MEAKLPKAWEAYQQVFGKLQGDLWHQVLAREQELLSEIARWKHAFECERLLAQQLVNENERLRQRIQSPRGIGYRFAHSTSDLSSDDAPPFASFTNNAKPLYPDVDRALGTRQWQHVGHADDNNYTDQQHSKHTDTHQDDAGDGVEQTWPIGRERVVKHLKCTVDIDSASSIASTLGSYDRELDIIDDDDDDNYQQRHADSREHRSTGATPASLLTTTSKRSGHRVLHIAATADDDDGEAIRSSTPQRDSHPLLQRPSLVQRRHTKRTLDESANNGSNCNTNVTGTCSGSSTPISQSFPPSLPLSSILASYATPTRSNSKGRSIGTTDDGDMSATSLSSIVAYHHHHHAGVLYAPQAKPPNLVQRQQQQQQQPSHQASNSDTELDQQPEQRIPGTSVTFGVPNILYSIDDEDDGDRSDDEAISRSLRRSVSSTGLSNKLSYRASPPEIEMALTASPKQRLLWAQDVLASSSGSSGSPLTIRSSPASPTSSTRTSPMPQLTPKRPQQFNNQPQLDNAFKPIAVSRKSVESPCTTTTTTTTINSTPCSKPLPDRSPLYSSGEHAMIGSANSTRPNSGDCSPSKVLDTELSMRLVDSSEALKGAAMFQTDGETLEESLAREELPHSLSTDSLNDSFIVQSLQNGSELEEFDGEVPAQCSAADTRRAAAALGAVEASTLAETSLPARDISESSSAADASTSSSGTLPTAAVMRTPSASSAHFVPANPRTNAATLPVQLRRVEHMRPEFLRRETRPKSLLSVLADAIDDESPRKSSSFTPRSSASLQCELVAANTPRSVLSAEAAKLYNDDPNVVAMACKMQALYRRNRRIDHLIRIGMMLWSTIYRSLVSESESESDHY
jgi:hypothetical protein